MDDLSKEWKEAVNEWEQAHADACKTSAALAWPEPSLDSLEAHDVAFTAELRARERMDAVIRRSRERRQQESSPPR